MKKKTIISIVIFLILIIGLILSIVLITNKKGKLFYLEDRYYGKTSITEIKMSELNQLIENKESFAVFVYQPMCVTSADFESVLYDFLDSQKLSVYKIAFADIKDTKIGNSVKYYPSFIIYNKGKMVDFLEADKDEDVDFYTSKSGFESWFTKYVKLRGVSSNDIKQEENKIPEENNNILEDVNLENVVKEKNKVNVYFFWGDGCPHCEKEFEFFESIKSKYKDRYNLYTFETWHNEENRKLLYTFSDACGEKVTRVPYTIIGDKTFIGFGENVKNEIIDAINSQYKNGYDVYFDKIKK